MPCGEYKRGFFKCIEAKKIETRVFPMKLLNVNLSSSPIFDFRSTYNAQDFQ